MCTQSSKRCTAAKRSATVGCEKGVARRGGASKDRAKLGMLELLCGTMAGVGAECRLCSELAAACVPARIVACMSCALLAAECGAMLGRSSSSCVARTTMGPADSKKLWPGRSSIRAQGGGTSEVED